MNPKPISTKELSKTEVQTHEEVIMSTLTNICGHLHMVEGLVDSLFPYSSVIHAHDPKIMAHMIHTRGQIKILLKILSKRLIRSDDKAIDIMFEQLGRTMSMACKMSIEDRNIWMVKIDAMELDFKVDGQ